jgi:E3 ubiquitin-protein ligase SHPRH
MNGIGRRRNAVASTSASVSNISTPEQDVDSDSETGTPSTSLPARDLSDALVDYCQTNVVIESPRKRQKTSAVSNDTKGTEPELEHIIVKQSSWDIEFSGSRLAELETPITRTNILFYVHWADHQTPEYIEIEDHVKTVVFHAPLVSKDDLEDVHLALLVHRDSKKWAKTQGRLWTELEISLQSRDGHDFVQLLFTVKWATTSSPFQLHQASARIPALSYVLQKYFPDPAVKGGESWSPQDFYMSAHVPERDDDIAATIQAESLETELYPFQKRAVQWLLRREGVEWGDGRVKECIASKHTPISFMQTQDDQGRLCFVSHLFSCVTFDIKPFLESEQQLKGGLLAEEMGLGKTLEIIALISLHQRPEETSDVHKFYAAQGLRPTKATLIISPPSILQQWIFELIQHSPNLKVFHYQGIREHLKNDIPLEDQDVVITTYGVLAAEIHHTPLNPEKSLRNEAKYPRPKSPLMTLSWWRCCIDEVGVNFAEHNLPFLLSLELCYTKQVY